MVSLGLYVSLVILHVYTVLWRVLDGWTREDAPSESVPVRSRRARGMISYASLSKGARIVLPTLFPDIAR